MVLVVSWDVSVMGCVCAVMGCASVLSWGVRLSWDLRLSWDVRLSCLVSHHVSLFLQAFVDFFSRGLQEEYRRQGIIIQVCVLLID